jgi:hypothetical protein
LLNFSTLKQKSIMPCTKKAVRIPDGFGLGRAEITSIRCYCNVVINNHAFKPHLHFNNLTNKLAIFDTPVTMKLDEDAPLKHLVLMSTFNIITGVENLNKGKYSW